MYKMRLEEKAAQISPYSTTECYNDQKSDKRRMEAPTTSLLVLLARQAAAGAWLPRDGLPGHSAHSAGVSAVAEHAGGADVAAALALSRALHSHWGTTFSIRKVPVLAPLFFFSTVIYSLLVGKKTNNNKHHKRGSTQRCSPACLLKGLGQDSSGSSASRSHTSLSVQLAWRAPVSPRKMRSFLARKEPEETA